MSIKNEVSSHASQQKVNEDYKFKPGPSSESSLVPQNQDLDQSMGAYIAAKNAFYKEVLPRFNRDGKNEKVKKFGTNPFKDLSEPLSNESAKNDPLPILNPENGGQSVVQQQDNLLNREQEAPFLVDEPNAPVVHPAIEMRQQEEADDNRRLEEMKGSPG